MKESGNHWSYIKMKLFTTEFLTRLLWSAKVVWEAMLSTSEKVPSFRGTYRSHLQCGKERQTRNKQKQVTSLAENFPTFLQTRQLSSSALYRSGSLTLGYWYQALSGFLTTLWSTARQACVLLSDSSCLKRRGTSHVADKNKAHWVCSRARRLASHDEPLANLLNEGKILIVSLCCLRKYIDLLTKKKCTPSRYYVISETGTVISCPKHRVENVSHRFSPRILIFP
jgi:hypothetical protein